ncbi:MAG: MarR family transcriptional regulator [Candidatus Omnitrophica bacterium]|nr:MarR family transcriptional regulator [Candidatus Omnitrophota bacterium]
MNIRNFAKEVLATIPYMHIEIIRRQPKILVKGKITFPQMVILDILRAKKGCKMSDVSKALGVTKSAVTGLTDRLIRAGFIRRARTETDRRVVKIYLTQKGLVLSRRLNDYKLAMISGLFRNISQKEKSQYLNILRKLKKNIKERMEYKPYE